VAVAKWVVQESLSGNVRGLALSMRKGDGRDEVLFTGAYRATPQSALGAAAHMYWVASERARRHAERGR
jgi:hypothetical protein